MKKETDAPLRHIPMEHMLNLRDLGGYAAKDGRTTLFGRLLRGDAACGLSAEEIRRLAGLGVRTAIDLRSPEEAERNPCSLRGKNGFAFHHIPFAVGNRSPRTREETPLIYWEIAADFPAMRHIMHTIARAEAAVLFFCAAGKDRTGVVAALLLLLAGVDRDDVLADYQVSYTYIRGRITDLLQREPNRPAFTGRSDWEYLDAFLSRMESEYGSCADYLKTVGLPPEETALLGQKLFESPEKAE